MATESVRKYSEWVSNEHEEDELFDLPLIDLPRLTSFDGEKTKVDKEPKRRKHRHHHHKRRRSVPPTIVVDRCLKKSRPVIFGKDEIDQISGPAWSGKSINGFKASAKEISSLGKTLSNGPDFVALIDGRIVSADRALMPPNDLIVNVDNSRDDSETITAVEGEPVRLISRPVYLPSSTKTGNQLRLIDSHSSLKNIGAVQDYLDSDDDEFPEFGLRRTILNTTFHPVCPRPQPQPICRQGFECTKLGSQFSGIGSLTGGQVIQLPPVRLHPTLNQSGQTVYMPSGQTHSLYSPQNGSIYPTSTPPVIYTKPILPISPQPPPITNPYLPSISRPILPQAPQPTDFRQALMNRFGELAGIGSTINQQLANPIQG